MHIASIGIDLGKTVFHVVALGERYKIVLRRKFSRSQLLAYTNNLPSSLIGMEACAGSHFLGASVPHICPLLADVGIPALNRSAARTPNVR